MKTRIFTIKNRFTGEVIVKKEAETLKEVVEENKANLREANLQGANLQRASLWAADLRGAKIKTSQKEDFLKSLEVIIED